MQINGCIFRCESSELFSLFPRACTSVRQPITAQYSDSLVSYLLCSQMHLCSFKTSSINHCFVPFVNIWTTHTHTRLPAGMIPPPPFLSLYWSTFSKPNQSEMQTLFVLNSYRVSSLSYCEFLSFYVPETRQETLLKTSALLLRKWSSPIYSVTTQSHSTHNSSFCWPAWGDKG